MMNVDPNTFINLSSSLTSIKLNRYISVSACIHLSIRIHLHYGFATFWSLALHQAWSNPDCWNIILFRKQSQRSVFKGGVIIGIQIPSYHSCVSLITTRKGLLAACIDVVLITVPVENIRIKSKVRNSSQTCAITLATFSKRQIGNGAQSERDKAPPTPAYRGLQSLQRQKALGQTNALFPQLQKCQAWIQASAQLPWPASMLPGARSSQPPEARRWLMLGLVSADLSYSIFWVQKGF